MSLLFFSRPPMPHPNHPPYRLPPIEVHQNLNLHPERSAFIHKPDNRVWQLSWCLSSGHRDHGFGCGPQPNPRSRSHYDITTQSTLPFLPTGDLQEPIIVVIGGDTGLWFTNGARFALWKATADDFVWICDTRWL